ncbi:unnamed protein product [Cochlearia groenlandica]
MVTGEALIAYRALLKPTIESNQETEHKKTTTRRRRKKRSFDFDQNNAEEADAEEEDESERRNRRNRSRGVSPGRTPSREREDSKSYRSRSRERVGGGGSSTRVSRFPGRRSDLNPNRRRRRFPFPQPLVAIPKNSNNNNNKPARFVYVPATEKTSNNNGETSFKSASHKIRFLCVFLLMYLCIEAWSPFKFGSDAVSDGKETSVTSSWFQQLIQKMNNKANEPEESDIKILGNMFLFKYLVHVIKLDFTPRNQLNEVMY